MGPCVAPGCRSNYRGQTYTTAFTFPKDKTLREKWIKCIPRKDFKCTTFSSLCIKHFREADLIDSVAYVDADGATHSVPSQRIHLRRGAFPSVWPGGPSYLSPAVLEIKQETPISGTPEDRNDDQTHNVGNAIQSDWIRDYTDLTARHFTKLAPAVLKMWRSTTESDCTVFYILSVVPTPTVKASIKVNLDLTVTVIIGSEVLDGKIISWVIPNDKIETWSQLEILLSHYGRIEHNESKNDKNNGRTNVVNAAKLVNEAVETNGCATAGDDTRLSTKHLYFLAEQLTLASQGRRARRFTRSTVNFAQALASKSMACYKWLRRNEYLVLPDPYRLDKVSHCDEDPNSPSTDQS